MSPNAPLTNEQREAVTEARVTFSSPLWMLGTAESVDQRARRPDPKDVPEDLTVRIEIAPPSPQPHPLLNTGALKTPERVPLYYYALRGNDTAESDSDTELANTHVIFFIHGGGNVVGHPTLPTFIQLHAQMLRAVASHSGNAATTATKCVLIAPSYRLATVPENVFPAALQDLVAAYDHVLGKGYDASNVVIAGDSAGGNHAIVLTHLVQQSSRPSPCGIVAFSPYAIQVLDQASEHANASAQAGEDILDVSAYERVACIYVGDSGVSRTDPLVSGAFISFTASWPRTLILVGTADKLIDGSRELEKRLKALNRPVELVEYQGRPHGWWVMPQIFPENIQDAMPKIARFILR